MPLTQASLVFFLAAHYRKTKHNDNAARWLHDIGFERSPAATGEQ
jgi:hypothetical protein